MTQFGAGKNPPWVRTATGLSVTAPGLALVSQPQVAVANPLLNQQGLATHTVYSLGVTQQPVPQAQYTSQQMALAQPGIAIPTTLATNQLATVSYPPPRTAQTNQPKQRVFTGHVTKLHENFGFVDEDVFFQISCVKGVMPKICDRVLVEATYNANMPFKWNATRIQVLPHQNQQSTSAPSIGPSSGSGVTTNQGGQQPPPLMGQQVHATPSLLQSGRPANRRDGYRDRGDRERRESRRDRRSPKKSRSPPRMSRSPPHRSRSPARRSRSPVRARSPARRRNARVAPRYIVQVPKTLLDQKEASVITLKTRYTNMYIPSDFFNARFHWPEAFPAHRPFHLDNPCNFHVMHKDVVPPGVREHVPEPSDADHLYSAKVMLLSLPHLDDLYHKSCALAEDPADVKESFQHPTRLIQFLVGLKGKSEPMAIGGPWSPSLDGSNPAEDSSVLIKTAIRTTKFLTGLDLSGCTQWYRFAEMQYHRPEESHKGRLVPARVETVVVFLPDVWSCTPSALEWETLRSAYKKQLQDQLSEETKEDLQEEEEEVVGEAGKQDPTHHSLLDVKTLKVAQLRQELDARGLNSKGLKSQLIARLAKALKTEVQKETQEAEEKGNEEEEQEDLEEKMETEEKEEDKKLQDEEQKKVEERERALQEHRYMLPDQPAIIIHPSPTAKSGKFDCTVMSLSVLLDYRPEDNKEHSFEISLFAELFNEMLMRDFGFQIYKALIAAPQDEKKDKKDSSEPSSKKRKTEEKSEKEDNHHKTKPEGNEAEDRNHVEEEPEEEEDDKKDKDKKRDKKREKQKMYTADCGLLLAFVYFDQSHTGYIIDKDLEEILHTLLLNLSRAQIKKLLQKVVTRDTFNYRKLTDRPRLKEGEIKESDDAKAADDTSVVQEDETLAAGNKRLLKCEKKSPLPKETVCGDNNKMVTFNGSLLDISSIMQRLERSEKTRFATELKLQELMSESGDLKSKLETSEESNKKTIQDLQDIKKKLREQKKCLESSESQVKLLRDMLTRSKAALVDLVDNVTSALDVGDGKDSKIAIKEESV